MNDALYARRKKVNALMFALTAVCAAVASGTLLAILGYIAWQGACAISWAWRSSGSRTTWESLPAWPSA